MLLKEITQPSDMQELKMRLASFRDWLTQGSHTPKEIATELENNIGDITRVEMELSPNVDKGDMNASAAYEQDDDEDGEIPFEITLVFSNKEDRMAINDPNPLINRILDMMKHEMIHQKQARARDFEDYTQGKDKRNMNYEYMSRPDEIEAYAMNIADELYRKVGKEDAIALLRMAKKTAQFKDEMGQFLSPDLFAYMGMWNFDSKHPVIKRLLKRIYQSLTSQYESSVQY
jgi:hypothetical protein